jgi:hypothetical protein
VPTPRSWSNADVNTVAAWPSTSPVKVFAIVATPTGSAVATDEVTEVGSNAVTSNVPEALMRARYPGLHPVPEYGLTVSS